MQKLNIYNIKDKMSIFYGYEQLSEATHFIESWLNEKVDSEALNKALDEELDICREMVDSSMPEKDSFSEEYIPNYWIDYQRIVLNYMIYKGGYDYPLWSLAFRMLCDEMCYDTGTYFADYAYHNNVDTTIALKGLPKEYYSDFKRRYNWLNK